MSTGKTTKQSKKQGDSVGIDALFRLPYGFKITVRQFNYDGKWTSFAWYHKNIFASKDKFNNKKDAYDWARSEIQKSNE